MRKIVSVFSAMVVVSTLFYFTSCDEDFTKIETKPAESALQVMKAFSDIILAVDDGLVDDSAKVGMRILGKDYTETITGDFPTKLLKWDFGTDGDYQGVLYILLSDEYANPNSVAQISFENFIYKGKPVSGLVTFENLGRNAQDMDEYGFELNEATVGTSKLSAGWKLQRTAGALTPLQNDDAFTISQIGEESASGVSDDGTEYTMTINEGIVLDLTCEHIITKGIFEILFGGSKLSADFGQGECDNLVNVNNGLIKADIYF